MSYDAEVIADTPALYWRMNESGGATTVIDSSGNGRNGTVTGGWNFAQTPIVADSISGSTSNGVGTITSGTIAFGATDVTVEMWMYVNGAVTYMPASFGVNYLDIMLLNNWIGINTGNGDLFGCPISLGLHHVVALVPNNKTTTAAKFYIDGVLQSVGGSSGFVAPNISSTYFRVSGWTSSGQKIPSGYNVDEVAVYAYELSAARVLAHFNAGVLPSQSLLSRQSLSVLATDTQSNAILSRQSLSVLSFDSMSNTVLSRQSVAVLTNDTATNRVLSRNTIQVLMESEPRFRGWGARR